MVDSRLLTQVSKSAQADMVTARQFLERCTLGASAAGLHLLRVGQLRAAADALPARLRLAPAFCRAGADWIALHVGQSAEHGIIKRPVLVDVSAHGCAGDRNGPPVSTISLTMANKSKVEQDSRSIRVTVTPSPGPIAFRSFNNSRRSGPAPVTFSR